MPFFFSGFLLKTGSSFFSGTGSRLGGGADWPGLKGGGAVKGGILKTGGAMKFGFTTGGWYDLGLASLLPYGT